MRTPTDRPRLSPLASRLSPLASRLSPLASRLSPLAQRGCRLPPAIRRTAIKSAQFIYQPIFHQFA
ncbi:hypothetical protein A8H37_02085 [Burkholderia thailandensis]|nr:hypothetical protein A8H37_02085 [Burkholderia thailandensis]